LTLANYRVRLSRLSALGIYFSLTYVLIGILAAPLDSRVHESLMTLTVGLLFPLSISLSAFIGPLKGGKPRVGYEALLLAGTMLTAVIAPPLYAIDRELGSLTASASLTAVVFYSIESTFRGKRRDPAILFFYPPLAGAIFMAYSAVTGFGPVKTALGLAMSYPVSLIFSFSALTMTRNYAVRVSTARVTPPLLLHAFSIIFYMLGFNFESLLLLSAFMLLHFGVIGFHRFPRLVERAFSMRSPVNRRAYLYIVAGHSTALIAAIVFAVYVIANMIEGSLDLLIASHLVYMGFVGLHIYLHAPLMAPTLAETRSAKRYNPIPLILLLLAAISRPLFPTISFFTVLASLAGLLLIIKPYATRG